MKIKSKSLEELELLPYDEIALIILKESKIKYTTINLFKEIGKILNLDDKEIEVKATDFFTALSTNKNFVLLSDGKWDLKSNHAIKGNLNNIDDYEEELDEIDGEEELLDDDIEEDSIVEDEEELDDDSDLDDLVIIDENDLEE